MRWDQKGGKRPRTEGWKGRWEVRGWSVSNKARLKLESVSDLSWEAEKVNIQLSNT
mgnify:CR=1 FL=1